MMKTAKAEVTIDSIMIAPGEWSATVRSLSKLDTRHFLLVVFVQWSIIAVSILAASMLSYWLIPFSMVVIATRQHALAILMHDAAHYRACKIRWLNDLISDFFCAFPLGVSTMIYRHFHLHHHSSVNTEADPDRLIVEGESDWQFPKSTFRFWVLFIRDLMGMNFRLLWNYIVLWSPLMNIFSNSLLPEKIRRTCSTVRFSRIERLKILGYFTSVLVVVAVTNSWFTVLIFWLVPQATALTAILRIRAIAEHYGVDSTHQLNETRTVIPRFLERLLICPLNVNFHIEHHLFPSIPFFNLPRIHHLLTQNSTVFQEFAHISEGYIFGSKSVAFELIEKPTLDRNGTD